MITSTFWNIIGWFLMAPTAILTAIIIFGEIAGWGPITETNYGFRNTIIIFSVCALGAAMAFGIK